MENSNLAKIQYKTCFKIRIKINNQLVVVAVTDFTTKVGGQQLDFRAGQIEHGVANSLPLLQCFFDGETWR